MDYLDIGFVLRGAVMQVVVFSIVPFLWWIVKYKKQSTFSRWIGLYKPVENTDKKKIVIVICGYFLVWLIASLVSDISSNFYTIGLKAIVPSFIVCFIQNGVAEEILFRGFIGKRLIKRFGVDIGNIIQAVLFGMLHIALALATGSTINITILVGYFIIPFIGGWMLGYMDEKIYNGSIIPGIILHGITNFMRDMILAFA